MLLAARAAPSAWPVGLSWLLSSSCGFGLAGRRRDSPASGIGSGTALTRGRHLVVHQMRGGPTGQPLQTAPPGSWAIGLRSAAGATVAITERPRFTGT